MVSVLWELKLTPVVFFKDVYFVSILNYELILLLLPWFLHLDALGKLFLETFMPINE